ncbi:MAG: SUMF1/EgtB/PvdO family nonheme iron enzyme [Magnetococcales bacterium]|nr:SUMF1/EgtB/PvdO family nonheme iron enzyme [Magnetococcales bacterium]
MRSGFYSIIMVVVLCLFVTPSLGAGEEVGASLLVKVIPRGAEVLIDDQVVGVAPILVEKVRPGVVQVRARLSGYRSWGKRITIQPWEKNVVTLILARSLRGSKAEKGVLEVHSEPSGAQWLLDGIPSGVTPARIEGVVAGSHKVSINIPGFGDKETEITVIGGETHQVMLRLASEGSRFWLDTFPAKATIRFSDNGMLYKPGMYLAYGRYQLQVSHPDYVSADIAVDINENDWSGKIALKPLSGGQSNLSPHSPVGTDRPASSHVASPFTASYSKPSTVVKPIKGPKTGTGEIHLDQLTGISFVKIPGNCPRKDNISPACLKAFWLGRFEVTNGQFRKFRPEHDSGKFRDFSLNDDEQPVVMVSWNDIQYFIRWFEKNGQGTLRLPLELEWEYAVRAGTDSLYYWGDTLNPSMLNFADKNYPGGRKNWQADDGQPVTASGTSYPANGYGVYNGLGNVWEWMADPYDDGSWPPDGSVRILRGGSWDRSAAKCQITSRGKGGTDYSAANVGYRLIWEP